jgi:hypothetical protein
MENENPYASPQYGGSSQNRTDGAITPELVDENPQPPWRWRDFILLPEGGVLPAYCVKCGAPTDRQQEPRKLRWFTPWLYLVILFNLLVFAICVLIGQRKLTVFFSLCEEHERRHRNMKMTSWALLVAAALQIVLAIYLIASLNEDWPTLLILSGLVTLLVGAIIGSIAGRLVPIERIEKKVVWLKRMPPIFYEGLPQLRSADWRKPIIPDFD